MDEFKAVEQDLSFSPMEKFFFLYSYNCVYKLHYSSPNILIPPIQSEIKLPSTEISVSIHSYFLVIKQEQSFH